MMIDTGANIDLLDQLVIRDVGMTSLSLSVTGSRMGEKPEKFPLYLAIIGSVEHAIRSAIIPASPGILESLKEVNSVGIIGISTLKKWSAVLDLQRDQLTVTPP